MRGGEGVIRLTREERRELQGIVQRKREPASAKLRATVVLMSAQGDSAAKISRVLGITERSVYRTRQRWRREAFTGLYDHARPGRPPKATAEYVKLLIKTAPRDPREVGYAFARWTSPRLAEYLKEKTGIELTAEWIAELLHMHGFVWRKGKLTIRNLQDPREKKRAQRWLKRLQQGALKAGAEYELWYLDGVRFDLLPVSRHLWRKKGRPMFIPTPGKNVRVPICGAFRYPDGPFLFSHDPQCTYVNTDLFVKLLGRLASRARRTAKKIILVMDNGSAFTSARSKEELRATREWIQVFWLPRYTSEQLNLIEGIWSHLKETYFSRMLTKKAEQFYRAVVRFLTRLCAPRALRAMLRPSCLLRICRKLPQTG